MKAKQKRKVTRPKQSKSGPAMDVPQFFRLNVEVGDLQSAISFYTKSDGHRRAQAGRFAVLFRVWTRDFTGA
jgi:hypothetical protein